MNQEVRLLAVIMTVAMHTKLNEIEVWNVSDLLRKEGMSLSLHLKGKQELTPLIYLPYIGYYSDHDFEQIVLALLGDESIVNERKYDAETLFDVSGSPAVIPGKFTFACINGIFLAGPSSIVVEHSVPRPRRCPRVRARCRRRSGSGAPTRKRWTASSPRSPVRSPRSIWLERRRRGALPCGG